jgi:hypothetical protein
VLALPPFLVRRRPPRDAAAVGEATPALGDSAA